MFRTMSSEEKVARAIHAATTPIISSVGHETDVTIADMVADTADDHRIKIALRIGSLNVPHNVIRRLLALNQGWKKDVIPNESLWLQVLVVLLFGISLRQSKDGIRLHNWSFFQPWFKASRRRMTLCGTFSEPMRKFRDQPMK
jgi:hypothetical protein